MSGKKVCYCVFKIKSNTKWSKNDSGIERFVVGRNGTNKWMTQENVYVTKRMARSSYLYEQF
jgi:hypothetical protein